MFYIYILRSVNGKKTYTGSTQNLAERLKAHNTGRVKSSRGFMPYELIYTEEYGSLKEARQRERYFKSTTGRQELKKRFFS